MKRIKCVCGVVITALLMISCGRLGEKSDDGLGRLRLVFNDEGEMLTKAYVNLPDTSEFLLKIADSSGEIIYEGKYGDCPEVLELSSGSYNIRVVSSEFDKPSFEAPQFGDEQCVTVPSGGVVTAELMCSQLNAGVRLKISSSFLTECPDAVLFLKSKQGKLMYSYSEKRTAYFTPGAVSLVMSKGGEDETLMVRNLNPCEMLTLKVSASLSSSSVSGSGISMSVDTSRVWIEEEYIIGSDYSGGDDDPLSISEAMASIGDEDVWVCGYIVGGDLTSAAASFQVPFKSRTNILLGPRSSTEDRESCISVQLPDGDVRDALNLVDNPGNLKKRVCIKGDIVGSYYGLIGLKNTSEYNFL